MLEKPMGDGIEADTTGTQAGTAPAGPLAGLRVIELGHFIAGPFATRLLADLGAEIIKVEPPEGGDPARGWGIAVEGNSLWWSVHARHKKCITLDLKSPAGRDIALKLIAEADAVIENFRPGQLERWGLGPQEIKAVNPDCILVRISGFGQNGPYRDKVSFGVIGEAMGGIRHLTAYPPDGAVDLPPVRTGVSLADSLAGIYGVVGLLAAIYQRDVRKTRSGQLVDVALYEAVFSLMEGCLPEYSKLGVVRQPAGSMLPSTAPSNAYRCADGSWICIAGNSDRIFRRLMDLIGRPELADDPRYATNWSRVANVAQLDTLIAAWAIGQPARAAVEKLEASDVPASIIYTIADCVQDPHFDARGMIQQVEDAQFGPLLHPGIVPQFDGVSPKVAEPGPALGAHTEEVLSQLLGLDAAAVGKLRADGIV
ncbi:CaiB/BaiF CoA transferase family protein [Roseixanthobacter glucoisosaccharinicivorans]|uniref:CaiB/BaiF CoA transferase family protein n=1 Tax=Roseixanthobacter glucoisosaccharinicivorans TaxID=3119923 RepID=UPI00372A74F5